MMSLTKPQKGSVLVFSLIVLAIVLSSALSITAVNVSNRKSAASTAQSVQSFQTADTATEKVMKAIYNGNYASLYLLYHDGLGSMACGESTPLSDGAPAPLILSDIVSQGVGSATVTFFDTNGARLVDCTATNWRDTLARVKVEGSGSSGSGAVRVIEVGIAPLSSMAWGENGDGRLGDGTTTERHTPVSTIGGSKWESVSAGGSHVLAVKSDGTLWAWGLNDHGQLGDNSNTNRTSPIQIGTDTTWKSVSAGDSHSLAIKTDHTMWAWGNGANHRLGTGNASDRDVPVQIAYDNSAPGDCVNNCPAGWKAVSAGSDFSLAIGTDDSLWSWGNNNNGRLGHLQNGRKPAQIVAGAWKFISAGNDHSLAVKSDDSLWAWGSRSYGKVGDGLSSGNATAPTAILSGTTWKSISAGNNHSLGVQINGTLLAWGRNVHGQLGNEVADALDHPLPTPVGALTSWNSVSAGNAHSLALMTNGADQELWSWGYDDFGQVGDNKVSGNDRLTRYQVPGNWQMIDAGGTFSIGVRK